MNLNATILGQTISFIMFVLFCMKYVWPPLMSIIENRQKEIAESIASAEKAKKDLSIAQANATNYLKQAKLEAQAIIEQANKYRNQILEEAKTEAKKERTKIITQAKDEIKDERKRAEEELRKQVAILAVACTEKIIKRSIDMNETINSEIVDQLIANL